jgi:hypothetical protein
MCEIYVHLIGKYLQALVTKLFVRTMLCFQQGWMAKECGFNIKIQSILKINNPNSIH